MIRHLITCAALLFATAFAGQALAAIDVNRASQAELESVKGIGPGLSGKILEARKTGDFKNWNDLVDRVGGVGPGNAAKFSQAGLTVAGAAYDGSAAPGKAAKGTAADKPAKDAKEPRQARAAKAPKDSVTPQ
jgi:competence protein ComEA